MKTPTFQPIFFIILPQNYQSFPDGGGAMPCDIPAAQGMPQDWRMGLILEKNPTSLIGPQAKGYTTWFWAFS